MTGCLIIENGVKRKFIMNFILWRCGRTVGAEGLPMRRSPGGKQDDPETWTETCRIATLRRIAPVRLSPISDVAEAKISMHERGQLNWERHIVKVIKTYLTQLPRKKERKNPLTTKGQKHNLKIWQEGIGATPASLFFKDHSQKWSPSHF